MSPDLDAEDIDAFCRAEAVKSLNSGDWYATYTAAKCWVNRGGGAWTPEAWLMYAASAALHGQPRTAVHSMDLGLGNWIGEEADRSILLWARASIVMRRMADPKTALVDFATALTHAPDWLKPRLVADRDECATAADVSRKRKASVGPAPSFEPKYAHDKVAPPLPRHQPGTQPISWNALLPFIEATPGDNPPP